MTSHHRSSRSRPRSASTERRHSAEHRAQRHPADSHTTAFFLLTVLFLSLGPAAVGAEPKRLRLIHTNDLQSRLLGFAPNADYSPETVGDDATVGGVARLATAIREARRESPGPSLLLDGGDFMMGTLFQTLGETDAAELQLMGQLGYDAAALGNHEFDFHPRGLARIVRAAARAGPLPPLLAANLVFDPEDPTDDEAEALFAEELLRPSLILERDGVRVGLFGLIGENAASVATYAAPVRFADPVETARKMVAALRAEGADLVVCLSHGGVRKLSDGSWGGEDVELLRWVPGLDAVIGGHSHTALPEPVLVDGRPVVQAGSEGRFLGVLDLEIGPEGARVAAYTLRPVDDSLAGDPEVAAQVAAFEAVIDERVLAPYGLGFRDEVFETAFDLVEVRSDPSRGNLGALVADALRWSLAERPGGAPEVAITTAGMIRDGIYRGQRGTQRVSDLFRVLPLGIGVVDQAPGHPQAVVYFTGRELKNVLEVLLVGHRLRGSNYYPFFSGLRFAYNPRRVPLDQVYEVEVGDEERGFTPVDLSSGNPRLYGVALNAYFLASMHLVDELSFGLVSIVPKDEMGRPIESIETVLVDADPEAPGLQESKEWTALVRFARQLPDGDGDGLPEIPERYREPRAERRQVASWSPRLLFRNATALQWSASLAVVLVPAGAGWWGLRRWRRRSASG